MVPCYLFNKVIVVIINRKPSTLFLSFQVPGRVTFDEFHLAIPVSLHSPSNIAFARHFVKNVKNGEVHIYSLRVVSSHVINRMRGGLLLFTIKDVLAIYAIQTMICHQLLDSLSQPNEHAPRMTNVEGVDTNPTSRRSTVLEITH